MFLKEHIFLEPQCVVLVSVIVISRACLVPKACDLRADSSHPSQTKSPCLVVWKFRLPYSLTDFHENCGQFGLAVPQA